MVKFVRSSKRNIAFCNVCRQVLKFDNEDLKMSFNFFGKPYELYFKCPLCGHEVVVEQYCNNYMSIE